MRRRTADPEVDRGRGPGVVPTVNAPVNHTDPVVPTSLEPQEPRSRGFKFEARIGRDGAVTIPAPLITPVLGAVLGWWSDKSSEEPLAPPAPSSASVPLSDDSIVDQRCAPVPKDLYLRLARSGAFPSKRIGKRICARWADVRAAFANYGKQPKPSVAKTKPAAPEDGLDDLRREIGLVPKGG